MTWRGACITRGVRLTSMLALVVLTCASGCSSKESNDSAAAAGAPAALDVASGSRLRAKILTGGGVREVAGFHDAQRNEDCTFQKAEAGHIRCLPATVTAFQSGVFADAACQVHTASVATTCDADLKYAISYLGGDGCGTQAPSELRKVTGPSAARYVNTGSGCALQTAVPPGQPAIVALGDIVPWTEFVEATETIVPGAGAAERVYVAVDGARAHAGFRDVQLGVDCAFQIMGDGVLRCAPANVSGPVLYGDADCTKALMVEDYRGQGGCSAKGETSSVWVEPTAALCSGLRAVYSLNDDSGVESLSQEIYSWQNDYSGSSSSQPTLVCHSNGTTSGGGYQNQYRRTIAANITASLASVPRVGGGSGRLVPTFVWPPGPNSVLVPGWHDTERDVDCSFAIASDGKTRCLPVAAKAGVFFTDDACKSTSLVAVPAETECLGGARFARTVSSACPATTTVYALSDKAFDLPGASIVNGPDRCAKVGGVTAAREATVVDPAQFVEGVPSVE